VQWQNFTIQLQSNPSTGYQWEPQFDSTTLSLVDSVFISGPNPNDLVGVAGSQNFTFQGITQGTSVITFNNIGPSNQTANSVTVSVTVTAADPPTTPTPTPTPTPASVGTLKPTTLTATTSNANPAVNQSFTVSGTLTANGTAVPNEQIVLLSENSANQWANLGTATTSANGSYSLTVSIPTQGSYILQATFYGDASYGASAASATQYDPVLVGTYQSTTLSMFVTNSTTGQPDTSGTEPVGQPFALYGFLTGTNGAPLSNKQITLFSRDPAGQQTALTTTTTAADGSFSFTRSESSQGAYFYWGEFSGDQNYSGCQNSNGWTAVTIGNVQNVTNSLYTTDANPAVNENFTLYGYLRDANGNGIPNEQIDLLCRLPTTPSGDWPELASTVTNAVGFYTFTVSEQSAGQYWYEAHFGGDGNYAAAFAGQTENIGSVTPTSLSLNTSIANPAPNQNFTLSGYLTDVSGTPVSGAQIDLWRQASGGEMVWEASRLTGTNGYYSFAWSEAQPGQFSYMVASESYQDFAISTASLSMTIGTLRPTALSVTTSNANPAVNQNFTLSGYLKDNATGATLSGKQITLLSEDPTGAWTNLGTTTTATDGSYTFTRSEASTGPYLYQVNSQSDTLYATSYAACNVLIGAA
jgi:predicted secreted protein